MKCNEVEVVQADDATAKPCAMPVIPWTIPHVGIERAAYLVAGPLGPLLPRVGTTLC